MFRFANVILALLLGLFLLAMAEPIFGQDPPGERSGQNVDTSIQYNLSTPGARSLAMGGAFLALADDATAAYTNPAGLTNLTLGGSEVTVEARHWRFANSYVDRGHGLLAGSETATGIGVDTVDGFQRDEARSDLTGLSFLSFAYVMPRGLVLAAYRHELANFETAFETQGAFFRDAFFDQFVEPGDLFDVFLVNRLLPQRSQTDLEIVNYGFSAGFGFELPSIKGMESNLSLGLGVSFYQFELRGDSEFFSPFRFGDELRIEEVRTEGVERTLGFFYGLPDFTPDNLRQTQLQLGDDDDVGVNLGLLWKLGRSQRWSIGGIFRQGPEFETTFTSTFIAFPEVIESSSSGTIHVPDVFGVGIAYRSSTGKTKIAFDVNRVRYSQQLEDFVPRDDEGNLQEGFNIDDADQVHLGFERIFLVVESLFVGTARFGAWNEPFHELEFVGASGPGSRPNFFAEFLDRPKDDEIHFSLGFGLVIKEDYQIDLAADLSDVGDTFSVSLVKFL